MRCQKSTDKHTLPCTRSCICLNSGTKLRLSFCLSDIALMRTRWCPHEGTLRRGAFDGLGRDQRQTMGLPLPGRIALRYQFTRWLVDQRFVTHRRNSVAGVARLKQQDLRHRNERQFLVNRCLYPVQASWLASRLASQSGLPLPIGITSPRVGLAVPPASMPHWAVCQCTEGQFAGSWRSHTRQGGNVHTVFTSERC